MCMFSSNLLGSKFKTRLFQNLANLETSAAAVKQASAGNPNGSSQGHICHRRNKTTLCGIQVLMQNGVEQLW